MEELSEEDQLLEEMELKQKVEEFKANLPIYVILALTCIAYLVISFLPTKVHAYTQEDAIKAIIGEAEGEPYEGKVAVACAIRNRGSLKGIYGLNSPRVKKELYSNKTMWDARKAWYESGVKDITNGASFWEGDRFQKPYWAKSMTETAHIGHQIFYRKD